jgi:hypothetical protein
MTYNKFTNGTLANADEVNESLSEISSAVIENAMNNEQTGSKFITPLHFKYNISLGTQPDLGSGRTYDTDGATSEYTLSAHATETITSGYLKIYDSDEDIGTRTAVGTINMFANSNYVETKVMTIASAGGGHTTSLLRLSDGTNHTTLISVTDASDTSVFRFQKQDANTVKWWNDGAAQSDINTTGWGANRYLSMSWTETTNSGAYGEYRIYYIFECDASFNYSYSATDTISSGTTITTSETNAIIVFKYSNLIPTINLSFDDGSSYTTATHREWTTISNLGTAYKVKFSWPAATFTYTDASTNTIPVVYGYGSLYG